jgi:hypothetical protein
MANHVLDLAVGSLSGTHVHLGYGGNGGLRDYTPRSPDLSERDFAAEALRSGAERVYSTMRNVTESATVLFESDSSDNLRAIIRSVEQILDRARLHSVSKRGEPVYVLFQPGGAGTVYRSQVLSGRVQIGKFLQHGYWQGFRSECVVSWERRFYWETATPTALTLSNSSGSSTSLTIYNHKDSDAGHDNYAEMAADQVTGSIPTPALITLRHAYNGGPAATAFTVGHALKTGSAFPSTIIEGESYGGGKAGITHPGGLATSSGQDCARVTLGALEEDLIIWVLTGASLAVYAGAPYRVLARFSSAVPAGTRARLRLTNGSEVVWQSELMALSTATIQELCTMELPPGLANLGTLRGLSLVWRGSGSGTLDVDFLQLTPLDSYRQWVSAGAGVAYEYYVTDNGPAGVMYGGDTSGNKIPNWYAVGGPILLWPGLAQRLYVLCYPADIFLRWTMNVSIYPRRLTV